METRLVPTSSILVGARDHICATLPFPAYHSVPVPTVRKERLFAGVLIGRGEYVDPGSGYRIWRPHLLAVFAVFDGSLEVLRSLPGADKPDLLGSGVSPIARTTTEYLEALANYLRIADTVLSAASKGEAYTAYRESLRQGFSACSGEVLLPYFDRMFMNDMERWLPARFEG